MRWPSRELNTDSQKLQSASEPVVAANVALKKEGETDPAETTSSYEPKSKSPPELQGWRFNPAEPRSDDFAGRTEISDPVEPGSPAANPSEHSNSPLDRLNAALTDDLQNALPERSVTRLEERLRVESLISHAKEMLEVGQLERARDAALTAQEIGETAQIDYSPDDDRPVDLVRRIESQLESTRLTHESSSETDASASVAPKPDLDSPPLATKHSGPIEREPKETTKPPRTWSTLFRREKKPTSPLPADPVVQTSNQVTTTPTDFLQKSTRNAISPRTEAHDAIVIANRGVSLGSSDPALEPDISSHQSREQFKSEPESVNLRTERMTESNVSDNEPEGEPVPVYSAEPTISIPESDDRTASLTVLESKQLTRPLPRRDVSNDSQIWPEVKDDTETDSRSTSTYTYVTIFIVVGSLMAIAFYRRRAR